MMLINKALIKGHRVEDLQEVKEKGKVRLIHQKQANQVLRHNLANHAELPQVANLTLEYVNSTLKVHVLKAMHVTSGIHQYAATSKRAFVNMMDVSSNMQPRLTMQG